MLNYKTLSVDVLKELSRFHSGYSLECISQSISKYAEIDERKDDKFAETARQYNYYCISNLQWSIGFCNLR